MSKCESVVLIDAHVHIQDCFALPQFFRCAYDNFKVHAEGFGGDHSAVLLLSEVAGSCHFRALKDMADNEVVVGADLYGAWTLYKTSESCSIEARSDRGESLFVMAGRQIVTQENLEILALMTETQFMEGEPLALVVESIKADGAVPVIPWGVGKWLGRRGRVLSDFIESDFMQGVFLGDNGCRPTIWSFPRHFKQLCSIERGRVLPGSDPLPLAGEVQRVGSFGFCLKEKLSAHRPAAQLKEVLRSDQTSIVAYGELRSTLGFLKDQISIRLK